MTMQKKFKFTNAKLKVIKLHDKDSSSTLRLNIKMFILGQGVAMLYLTGSRRSEIFNLKWFDFDRDSKTVYVPDSKSGLPFTIYLSGLF